MAPEIRRCNGKDVTGDACPNMVIVVSFLTCDHDHLRAVDHCETHYRDAVMGTIWCAVCMQKRDRIRVRLLADDLKEADR